MHLGSKPNVKQIQTIRHLLSPKVIQLMKTFQLSFRALCDEIDQFSEDNVFLDVKKSEDFLLRSASYQVGDDVSDYAKTPDGGVDLQSHLIIQIEMLHLSQQEESILKFMITYLDDRGYMAEFETVCECLAKEYGVTVRYCRKMLKLLQTLEPEGVGARSVKECLQIQLDHMQLENEPLNQVLSRVIGSYLNELGDQKYDEISRKLDIEVSGVSAIASYIKSNFDPAPGLAFLRKDNAEIIIPSFDVRFKGGDIRIINLEKKKGVKISLSERYLKLLEDPNTDAETKAYLSEKFDQAKTLIYNVEQRHQETERLVHYLVEKQRLFLEKGSLFLNPLLQKEVARELGRNPSTISRMVSSKYIYTPQGVIRLKQLCPRDHFGKTARQLRLMIKRLAEDHPHLSDAKLADLLADQGIKIARRTVNKYRLMGDS
jgi:RNA polymerase sigma-54 factor